MAGIFYDPRVHDFGSQAVHGVQSGLAMAAQSQQMEANQLKLDEAKKIKAVQDEIKTAWKEYEGDMKAPESVSGADAGFEPTQAGTALAAEQGTQAEGQGLAGVLAAQQSAETKSKPLVAKAQFMTKAKEIFEKHGMVDQAMAIENNYMKHVGTIATTVGKKAALKELKQGMFASSFEGVTEKDIIEKDGTWKIEKLGPNNDGIVTMSPDGKVTIVAEPTPKEEKKEKDTVVVGHDLMQRQPDGSYKKIHSAPFKEGGGSGSGGSTKTTGVELTGAKGIIQQKYIDLAKEQAKYEGMDPEELGKINTTNYYTYLTKEQKGTHDRAMIDAQEHLKKYPKEPAKAANEALKGVQGKQAAASGKVGDESKGLIRGKFTKVVEDPKTKKRYGVKPDGTKEPL